MARLRETGQSSTERAASASQSQLIDVSGASCPVYQLPAELMLSILGHLYLNDLVGFACSCRFVYSLAGAGIEQT